MTVLGTRIGDPSSGKFFSAMMIWDEEENLLRSGDHAVVTSTIGDAEAPPDWRPVSTSPVGRPGPGMDRQSVGLHLWRGGEMAVYLVLHQP